MSYPLAETLVKRNSADRKLGGMSATYRVVGPTCPPGCPLLGNGCYAQRGYVDLVARRHVPATGDLDYAAGIDLVRHLVSGDWFRRWGKHTRLDRALVRRVIEWHKANPRTQGFSYTHDWRAFTRAGLGPRAWPSSFRILASVHTSAAAQQARRSGWQTARVIDRPDDREAGEILCPYDLSKYLKRQPIKVTCRTCRACFDGYRRPMAFLKI